ncbi:hypothetical protein HDV01_006347 [Terramyces sp. JEL0728]|nr:hypothetical protein HDV01_006347 [Terramyces sp. JEL0728]
MIKATKYQLTVGFGKTKFAGQLSISFSLSKPTKSISLAANHLSIFDCSVVAFQPLNWAKDPVTNRDFQEAVSITNAGGVAKIEFEKEIPVSNYILHLKYQSDYGEAIQKHLINEKLVYYGSKGFIPHFEDEPVDVGVSVYIQSNYSAISNGDLSASPSSEEPKLEDLQIDEKKLVRFDSVHIPLSDLKIAVGETLDINDSQIYSLLKPLTSLKAKYPIVYPEARRQDLTEDLHGYLVSDSYRWLEDPDSPETEKFVREQAALTRKFLSNYPVDKITAKLKETADYEKYSSYQKHGDFYYYFYNAGLQGQSVIYRTKILGEKGEIFFDPNTLSSDGTVSLSTYDFSKSGRYFGYALSESGSDWVSLHVLDTVTNAKIGEPLEWAKFTSINWLIDESGFMYIKYPKPAVDKSKAGTETDLNLGSAVYFHRLNEPQDKDVKIFQSSINTNFSNAHQTKDGKYIVIEDMPGTEPQNVVFYATMEEFNNYVANPTEELKLIPIVDKFEFQYTFVCNRDSVFYFHSTHNAPNKQMVSYDVSKPEQGFTTVIPVKDSVLEQVDLINNHFVTVRLENVQHVLELFDIDGQFVKNIELPTGAMVAEIIGKEKDDCFFYKITSFTIPGEILKYDFNASQSIIKQKVKMDLESLTTTQVFYPSKDGTTIPMYIIHKKNMELNSSNPAVLYGYGGFGVPILPTFSPPILSYVEHFNGIYCFANLRGGGEFGLNWHNQGRLKNKQNVFDDFQYAAKFLVQEKYTSHNLITINGGSNGGLLIGACINQAPELFGCGVAEVGVMDLYRFHKFTIGYAWKSDYGDPDVKEDFEVLKKISPLHNVTGKNPPIMILTGDHDDRVVPLHSLKLIAEMQHKKGNTVLGRIDIKAGHGAGQPISKILEKKADMYAFIALTTGAEWHD